MLLICGTHWGMMLKDFRMQMAFILYTLEYYVIIVVLFVNF